MPLTYCDMNVEIDEYHDITIRFTNLCRICGESALDGIDIFAAKGIEFKLREKINLHMPISIDIQDSMPHKVCIDCCNKLEIVHMLVVSCLRADIRMKRFLNIERQAEYDNKYNALIHEYSLEVAQEICVDDGTNPNSFITNKIVNPSETNLRELGNGVCSDIQNHNFQSITKNIVPSELNTLIQSCTEVNSKVNENIAEEILQIQQDKIQNESHSILCLQCQTLCDTQEIFENHQIFCSKKEDVAKHLPISRIAENKKYRNDQVSCKIKNSQTYNKSCENKQVIDKAELYESIYCTVCNQAFKCQQDYDNHKCLHENLINGLNKKCGHCKKVYHNKKDLLNHIVESHEGRLLFQCSTCDKMYEKWSSLDIHEATHRLDKPYLCDLCGKSFKHSNNLRGHKRIHLDESIKKRHMCEICGSAFRSRFHLREHMNQHDGNRPYSCEQCGKAFYKRIQLRQHKLSHGFNRHTCPICGATFNRRGNMNAHMKRHNAIGTYTCSVCAYKCKSMSELKIHRKKHSEEEIVDSIKKKCNDKEIWRCNVCNKVFPKRTVLINHERVHGDDKLYECEECGKKLASKSSLIFHKKSIHLRERSHMCHICGIAFVSKEARLIHERIHTGERPYVCKVCNTRYRCSSNLSQHMKIHTGLKPHKCHHCNKSFTRKGALIVHERIHTGIKPYPCETCGRSFSQKNDMLKHAKTHKLMQCNECNELFRRKKDMLKHMTTHKQETSVISNYVDSPSHIRVYASTTASSDRERE
ncbi:zinc finger protein 2-like isoform X2 [Nylanderia fulva]|nr:zinc finger protein 2-like isoform X2 [Nylanderia fulva]